ncbi:MAG: 30S ribosomal protein S3 [Candidatus Bathyarchaeota archaeon]|nr:30S ribosomal protein S3 [Candidatus Bathyarchaeota archaeon]MCZ2845147.1 30S ribosomal protein S3 [Candidatus Bathyarchaeota archaeon]
MSIHKFFIKEGSNKTKIDEFLAQELQRAGYSKLELMKTPLGTRVVIFAAKPGMVIGRRGENIRGLTSKLERFGVENPQISVAAVEIPEFDPKIMASQITTALQKGIHFRRAAYWAINRIMDAGALGVEVIISGKLTTERGRSEKFRIGYLPKVGDAVLKSLKVAVVSVQLKPGILGVKVTILPPDVDFPDKPSLKLTEGGTENLESEEEKIELANNEKE